MRVSSLDFSKPGKVHVIGICGVGMSAVALLLRDAGWQVTGSDGEAVFPPVTDFLDEAGIKFARGFGADNIPADIDFFVIGKNANLKQDNNEEVAAAFARQKPILGYPDVLAALGVDKHRIVVAGSYGKSTTTAILSFVLREAGLDPSWFIGAFPLDMERHAFLSKSAGAPLVLEGDEYPSSNTDPRPKFAHYTPHDVILTSATPDHPEIYPTPEDFRKPFAGLLANMPKDGALVACVDNDYVRDLLREAKSSIVSYGLEEKAEWTAANIKLGAPTRFDLIRDGQKIITLETPLLGRHNIQNIVGVAALCLVRKWMTPEVLKTALAKFHGIRRRLINLTSSASVPVLEAFGSTDKKLQSALAAVREHFPDRRVILIFEPSTFGWRNRPTEHWYAKESFAEADDVIVTWLSGFAEQDDTHLGYEEVVAKVRDSGAKTLAMDDPETVMAWLRETCTGDEVILLSSSRTLMGLTAKIPDWVHQSFSLSAPLSN